MTTTLEPPTQVRDTPATRTVTGVLDIDAHGKGHLRAAASLLPSPADPDVSPALIRRHGLRKGDLVEGVAGPQRALTEVTGTDGRAPGGQRRHFRDLTPCTPTTGSAWSTPPPAWPAA